MEDENSVSTYGSVTHESAGLPFTDLARWVVKSFVEGIQLMTTNPEVSKQAVYKYLRLQQKREPDDAYQLLRSFMRESSIPLWRDSNPSRRS
jgi:type IV secretory pathway TrbF-like protein